MIKNIILDIGNVLLSFKPKEYFTKVLGDEKKSEEIIGHMLGSDVWKEYDLGNYTLKNVEDNLKSIMPQYTEEIELILSNWTKMLEPITYTMEKMEEWKQQGYGIYLLSNLNKEADEYIQEHFNFYEKADGMVLSYKVHLAKPDTRMYAHICDKYNLQPSECLFIDDCLDNVLSAITFGIASIHFKDVEQVKHDLEHIFETE